MKKNLFYVMMLVLSIGFFASCNDEEKIVSFETLPSRAQTFIRENFDASSIVSVQYDKEFSDKEYKVIFANADFINFNKSGEWDEIYMPSGVPAKLIPAKITTYVEQKHPGASILSIDRERNHTEIELNNSLDLIFDLQDNFIRYDD